MNLNLREKVSNQKISKLRTRENNVVHSSFASRFLLVSSTKGSLLCLSQPYQCSFGISVSMEWEELSTMSWIRAFLGNRSQTVVTEGEGSGLVPATSWLHLFWGRTCSLFISRTCWTVYHITRWLFVNEMSMYKQITRIYMYLKKHKRWKTITVFLFYLIWGRNRAPFHMPKSIFFPNCSLKIPSWTILKHLS